MRIYWGTEVQRGSQLGLLATNLCTPVHGDRESVSAVAAGFAGRAAAGAGDATAQGEGAGAEAMAEVRRGVPLAAEN